MRPPSAIAAVLLSSGLLACAAGPRPCVSPACEAGAECLANRCSPAGADPVAPDTERAVLDPIALAVSGEGAGVTPYAITLGGQRARNAALLLRFGTRWKDSGSVESAFLLLTPAPGTVPTTDPTSLDVWTIGAHWSEGDVARGPSPRLVAPRATGLAPPGGALVRIDVTRVVRALRATPHDDGLAVVAPRSTGPGLALLTGAAGGGTPRLELYLRTAGTPPRAW